MGDDSSTKRPHRRSKRVAAQVDRLDLAVACLNVKRTGVTYEEVAAKVPGVSGKGQAWKLVQEALAERVKERNEPADAIIAMELDLCDEMQVGLYDAATTGDVQAVNAMLKVQERRAKYRGLDAPTKTDTKVDVGVGVADVLAAIAAAKKNDE